VIFINKTPMSVKKGKIYKIVNKINGKVYVGCTINTLEQRFYEHLYRCNNTDYKSKLYNSIKKYGEENFEIDLIEECDLTVLYENEKKYIEKFKSFSDGLNSTYGGEGCLGYIHSEEIRKKISENTKNGNSHRGKSYEQLYGEKAQEEKNKRKKSVSESWISMSDTEKKVRIDKLKSEVRQKSKYGEDLIKEVKTKFREGLTIKEVSKLYPQISKTYLYSLRDNKRWKEI
jgi:group I intron endonuclease